MLKLVKKERSEYYRRELDEYTEVLCMVLHGTSYEMAGPKKGCLECLDVLDPEPLPAACMNGVCSCESAPDGYDQHRPWWKVWG